MNELRPSGQLDHRPSRKNVCVRAPAAVSPSSLQQIKHDQRVQAELDAEQKIKEKTVKLLLLGVFF